MRVDVLKNLGADKSGEKWEPSVKYEKESGKDFTIIPIEFI